MSKKVVVIGGGTGTFTILSGLKIYPLDLAVVVSMTDSGGSNRILRDEFGLLPTSDIRQCLVALASDNSDETLRKLFTYRYENGTGIAGMTFGNLFMAALSDILGNQENAIEETCKILKVKGQILPVTFENTNLVAKYENGKEVLGEHYIDEPDKKTSKLRIVNLQVFPKAKGNKKALLAIKNADLIILGPGDLYTSIICNLVVDGIGKAVAKSKAKKLYVVNLMTRLGQTTDMTASDHVREVEKYLGSKLDYLLVNKSSSFPSKALAAYREEGAIPVKDDLGSRAGVIRANLVASKIFQKSASDKLVRSLIRHDSDKLAKAVMTILK